MSYLFGISFVLWGIAQLIAGYDGIVAYAGIGWGIWAILIGVLFRFTLPITVGAFYGAMTVWGWPWYYALLFSAPGLALIVPGILISILGSFKRDSSKKIGDELRSLIKNNFELEQEAEQEDKELTKSKNDLLEADWNMVINNFNAVIKLYENLYQLSPEVAFTYKLYLIESKKFNQAKEIARKCENEFFRKFFGSNRKILKFAKWLLENGYRKAAADLNRTVNVLGDNLNAKKVIRNLITEHKIDTWTRVDMDLFMQLLLGLFLFGVLLAFYFYFYPLS